MPSTAIEWAHWKNNVLSVKYRGGDAYDYFGVPESVYRDYKEADVQRPVHQLRRQAELPLRKAAIRTVDALGRR